MERKTSTAPTGGGVGRCNFGSLKGRLWLVKRFYEKQCLKSIKTISPLLIQFIDPVISLGSGRSGFDQLAGLI